MALNAGSVNLDGSGDPQGTGLARAMYDAWEDTMDWPSGPSVPASAIVAGKQRLADACDALAGAIVGHITDNAEVTITVGTSDAGLQRMPESTTEDTPCKAPGSPVELTTKGTVA